MSNRDQIRLLIGGPANSGKSTLSTSLFREISVRPGVTVGLHEIDVYSDTHGPLLGHKPWSEREKQWGAGLPEVQIAVSRFTNAPEQIVIGDLPGNIHNEHLQLMMSGGTHSMYVGRDFSELDQWKEAFAQADVPMEWVVQTRINGDRAPPLPGTTHILHDLNREVVEGCNNIKSLADDIVRLWQRTAHTQA